MTDAFANAQALWTARRAGKRIDGWPGGAPGTPADVYAIHDAAARISGKPITGWKVANITAQQQKGSGIGRPVCAPLMAEWSQPSPGKFPRAAFTDAFMVECEFAFELGVDIPPRATPYTRAEIVARIASVRPAIEFIDKRVVPAVPVEAFSDFMASGGFVFGKPVTPGGDLNFGASEIVLTIDGKEAARGTGAAIKGDPLLAVVDLANAPPPWTVLRAGQIVTTGSCTGVVKIPGPCTVKADHGPLGSVEVVFI
jgi:2-keto-4-pentenoate hydratase